MPFGPKKAEDRADHDQAGEERVSFGNAQPIDAPTDGVAGHGRGKRTTGMRRDVRILGHGVTLSIAAAALVPRRQISAMRSLVMASPSSSCMMRPRAKISAAVAYLRELLIVCTCADD
jgi:hypothetical protein